MRAGRVQEDMPPRKDTASTPPSSRNSPLGKASRMDKIMGDLDKHAVRRNAKMMNPLRRLSFSKPKRRRHGEQDGGHQEGSGQGDERFSRLLKDVDKSVMKRDAKQREDDSLETKRSSSSSPHSTLPESKTGESGSHFAAPPTSLKRRRGSPPSNPPYHPMGRMISSPAQRADVEACFSKLVSEVPSIGEMIRSASSYCKSSYFTDFVSFAGISEPKFKPSPFLWSSDAHVRFANAWHHLPQAAKLSVVFHGTDVKNILHILAEGLDVKRRNCQAYGPGEYFAKNPGMSSAYCRDGLLGQGFEMLVFLVVVPEKYPCPADMVVVNNNNHQLPLGSITFTNVETGVFQASTQRQRQLSFLTKLAIKREQEAKEVAIKAEIIQRLIGSEIDIASEKYQKQILELQDTSKREISMYVHRMLDDEIIPVYFPELPKPMMAAERDTAPIPSVDEAKVEAFKAKAKLDMERSMSADDGTPMYAW